MYKYATKSGYIFALMVFVYTNTCAVTINGRDINDLVKKGDALTYTDLKSENIFFSIKNGNIEIGSLKLTNIEDVANSFKELENNKDQLSKWLSEDTVHAKSGAHIKINGGYVSGNNKVVLDAHTSINISNAIIKSKKVALLGSEFKLDNCFIDTDTLQLEPNSSESLFEAIVFTFNKNIKIPTATQGHINFEKDETIEDFLVVGAQKVAILFSPRAFESDKQ
jgi:hypothetical protein